MVVWRKGVLGGPESRMSSSSSRTSGPTMEAAPPAATAATAAAEDGGAGGIGDGGHALMVAGAAAADKDPYGGVEVLFVRHAESRNNVLHAEVGSRFNFDPSKLKEMDAEVAALRSEDADLSPKGYQQAAVLGQHLAARLKGKRVLVLSSPMVRAIRTIEPAVQKLGLPRERWLCYGHYYEVGGCYLKGCVLPGRSRKELEAVHQLRCVGVPEGGWFADRQSKETHQEALLRCEEAALFLHDLLLSTFPSSSSSSSSSSQGSKGAARRVASEYDVIVCVGHGEFMHLLLKKLVGGGGLHTPLGFVHGNTACTSLQFHPQRGFLLRSLNGLEHLPPPLRTGHALADGWWEVVPRPLPTPSNRPLIHRFPALPDEDKPLYTASQAVRRRYLGAVLAEYARHVDAQATHFLALAPGQATVVGVALFDPQNGGRLRQLVVVPGYRGQGLGYGLLQAVRQEAKARGATQLLAHASLAAPVVGPLPLAKEGGASSSNGDGGASASASENPALSFLLRKGGFNEEEGTEGVYTDRRGRPCRRLVAPL